MVRLSRLLPDGVPTAGASRPFAVLLSCLILSGLLSAQEAGEQRHAEDVQRGLDRLDRHLDDARALEAQKLQDEALLVLLEARWVLERLWIEPGRDDTSESSRVDLRAELESRRDRCNELLARCDRLWSERSASGRLDDLTKPRFRAVRKYLKADLPLRAAQILARAEIVDPEASRKRSRSVQRDLEDRFESRVEDGEAEVVEVDERPLIGRIKPLYRGGNWILERDRILSPTVEELGQDRTTQLVFDGMRHEDNRVTVEAFLGDRNNVAGMMFGRTSEVDYYLVELRFERRGGGDLAIAMQLLRVVDNEVLRLSDMFLDLSAEQRGRFLRFGYEVQGNEIRAIFGDDVMLTVETETPAHGGMGLFLTGGVNREGRVTFRDLVVGPAQDPVVDRSNDPTLDERSKRRLEVDRRMELLRLRFAKASEPSDLDLALVDAVDLESALELVEDPQLLEALNEVRQLLQEHDPLDEERQEIKERDAELALELAERYLASGHTLEGVASAYEAARRSREVGRSRYLALREEHGALLEDRRGYRAEEPAELVAGSLKQFLDRSQVAVGSSGWVLSDDEAVTPDALDGLSALMSLQTLPPSGRLEVEIQAVADPIGAGGSSVQAGLVFGFRSRAEFSGLWILDGEEDTYLTAQRLRGNRWTDLRGERVRFSKKARRGPRTLVVEWSPTVFRCRLGTAPFLTWDAATVGFGGRIGFVVFGAEGGSRVRFRNFRLTPR